MTTIDTRTGSLAPFDDALARAGLIVPEFHDELLGYENADELEADGWLECPSFGRPTMWVRLPWSSPEVEARPITRRVLRWRWT